MYVVYVRVHIGILINVEIRGVPDVKHHLGGFRGENFWENKRGSHRKKYYVELCTSDMIETREVSENYYKKYILSLRVSLLCTYINVI